MQGLVTKASSTVSVLIYSPQRLFSDAYLGYRNKLKLVGIFIKLQGTSKHRKLGRTGGVTNIFKSLYIHELYRRFE